MSENGTEDMKKKLVASGVQIGTRVKTKFMKPFIIKTETDGTYTMDIDITIERIKVAAKFINRIEPKNVIVCSGSSYPEKPIERFCDIIGATKMLGRFMPGTLTNPALPYYIEPKLVVISDPLTDLQAIMEATNAGIPVIGIANTDNLTSNLDVIIPANNKGRKALAATYWYLVREILIIQGKMTENDAMKEDIDSFETKTTELKSSDVASV